LHPIGVFDSGVGGLSVAHELMRAVPAESLLYYADTAHVPYGGRPLDEVRGFALHICDFLVERGAKMIVMACNISSAIASEAAQERYPDIPVIGVVRPGARAAVISGAERIGVLATQGTVNSGAYERAIHEADKGIHVRQVACPKFVPLVESDQTETPEAYAACCEALAPLASGRAACDAVILGCTHYPFLLPMLQRAAAELFERRPLFIDPAGETAHTVRDTLLVRGLNAPVDAPHPAGRYFVSGDVEQFRRHAPLLLGAPVGVVEQA
jgi:glutamate racemase